MKITIRNANLIAMSGHSTDCILGLDAKTIQFLDGGDEYDLEEVRTVMRLRRAEHTRKIDDAFVGVPTHYIMKRYGAYPFVKEAAFFREQGGLTSEWGKRWIPVVADSIEDARTK